MNVIFVEQRNYALTRNNNYEVIRETRDKYYVRNDNGNVAGYIKGLFIIAEEDQQDQVEHPVEAVEAVEAPRETAAQRRRREEREERERIAAEEREVEARRGAVRTEQTIADELTVTRRRNGSSIYFTITADFRERTNDQPQVKQINIGFGVNGCQISCGIHEVGGMQAFIINAHRFLDYQDNDWDLLRNVLFEKLAASFNDYLNTTDHTNGAFILASVVTNGNADEMMVKPTLIDYFGFQEAIADAVNPNSNNTICFLVRNRR